MAITVKDASYVRGHSLTDHLLDDSDLVGIIGQSFPTLRIAQAAARDLSTERSPIALTVLFPDGSTAEKQDWY